MSAKAFSKPTALYLKTLTSVIRAKAERLLAIGFDDPGRLGHCRTAAYRDLVFPDQAFQVIGLPCGLGSSSLGVRR